MYKMQQRHNLEKIECPGECDSKTTSEQQVSIQQEKINIIEQFP